MFPLKMKKSNQPSSCPNPSQHLLKRITHSFPLILHGPFAMFHCAVRRARAILLLLLRLAFPLNCLAQSKRILNVLSLSSPNRCSPRSRLRWRMSMCSIMMTSCLSSTILFLTSSSTNSKKLSNPHHV